MTKHSIDIHPMRQFDDFATLSNDVQFGRISWPICVEIAMRDYRDFLGDKLRYGSDHGVAPVWMPEWLYPFQASLVEWALRKGRAAIFADCGLGKTPMQLVWAENILRVQNGRVLIITPIAVGQQTKAEAEKFGIAANISRDGKAHPGTITITNYEQLHKFDSSDFAGVVCDESSAIKDAKSATRATVTQFLRRVPFRLLCTATAAPNDWHELGTSSEVLGYLGFRDMITTFFKQETNKDWRGWGRTKYRFREHAKRAFWRWVCSWARACRKPSDLGYGFDDTQFQLPELTTNEHLVRRAKTRGGFLFDIPAQTLPDQREERRATLNERCEKVAELVGNETAVIWCHLNDEGKRLSRVIRDCVEISGADSEESKEDKLLDFSRGNVPRLVIKPKIGAWGLNWQHCNRIVTFPSHSFEQYYQSVRRCWRFGQKRPVTVDIVTTEGEQAVMSNLSRKASQADAMFSALVAEMNHSQSIEHSERFEEREVVPSWLVKTN